ncbi:MAG: hypothetical protein JSU81_05405 [Candidatus Coatesbacteria bacterium]|nr:MAG: hypothetical protein JSU81_05405 [Candidatus Coatesbacteria bacterium]
MKRYLPFIAITLLAAVSAAFVIWAHLSRPEVFTSPGGSSAVAGKVCLIPIGEVPKADVAFAAAVLEADFGRDVVIADSLPLQEEYYYEERDQYSAAGFLKYVEANAPREAYRVVGLTAADITIRDLNFLFGMGRCPGRCAVMSTYRLGFYCSTEYRRRLRFAKLTVHEMGHTFGLLHCRRRTCIMKFAEGYVAVDFQRLAMCERCEEHFCGVAAVDREARRARLEAMLKKYGLWQEVGEAAGLTPPPAPADLTPEETEAG